MILKIVQTLAVFCLLFRGGSFRDEILFDIAADLRVACVGEPGTASDWRGRYLDRGCWGYIFCSLDGGKEIKLCYPEGVYNNVTKLCEAPTLEMNECNKMTLCSRKRDGFYEKIQGNKTYQYKCLGRKYVQLFDCDTGLCEDNLG